MCLFVANDEPTSSGKIKRPISMSRSRASKNFPFRPSRATHQSAMPSLCSESHLLKINDRTAPQSYTTVYTWRSSPLSSLLSPLSSRTSPVCSPVALAHSASCSADSHSGPAHSTSAREPSRQKWSSGVVNPAVLRPRSLTVFFSRPTGSDVSTAFDEENKNEREVDRLTDAANLACVLRELLYALPEGYGTVLCL